MSGTQSTGQQATGTGRAAEEEAAPHKKSFMEKVKDML